MKMMQITLFFAMFLFHGWFGVFSEKFSPLVIFENGTVDHNGYFSEGL